MFDLFKKKTLKHWNHDLLAGFSVSLVALPLGLGIALASGAPAYAGIIAALVGGILGTFLSGTHVVINGPGAGLIVVTLGAIHSLDNGDGRAFQYVLAAYIISGIILSLMGVFKLGKYSNALPSTVIQGLMAAIGVIIMIKQIHVLFDIESNASNNLDAIINLPNLLHGVNPYTAIIGLISLFVLIAHPRIKNKFVHYIPSIIWVVLFSVLLVYLFDFFDDRKTHLFGNSYHIGPHLMIQVPENFMKGLMFPDFSRWNEFVFWGAVFNITLISAIENILSASAAEKLDPERRKTKYNKDLIGVGLSTVVSAGIGGLPAISVISRSSVNINHGAKTKMSNLYHGIFILIYVLIFPGLIEKLPLAALAAILVYTGYKLASPKQFREMSYLGWEQFLVFISTLFFTLWLGLLYGILAGMLITLVIHYYKLGLDFKGFVGYVFNPFVKVVAEENRKVVLKVKGVSNFLNLISLQDVVRDLPPRKLIIADFSHTRLVDNTTLEFIHDYAEEYSTRGGKFEIIGLGVLKTSSNHPYSLHVHERPRKSMIRLTNRQSQIKNLAAENGWLFNPEMSWDVSEFSQFMFFKSRPVEYKKNTISGKYENMGVTWEFCDITFDEGALLAREVYHTSVEMLKLPVDLPVFSLEKEVFMDKVIQLAANEDIDFKGQKQFSKRYLLKGPNEEEIRSFFTQDLIDFFNKGDIYHLESNGDKLLVFRFLRLATPNEIGKMIRFSNYLMKRLIKKQEQENGKWKSGSYGRY